MTFSSNFLVSLFVVCCCWFFFFNLQLKQAGSVCRASAGECDLPEYCTGASQDCPDDSFEMNGKPCYNQAEGYCHDGQCPTHHQHCWRLFGPGTPVHPVHPAHPALQHSCFFSSNASRMLCKQSIFSPSFNYGVNCKTVATYNSLDIYGCHELHPHNDLCISNWSVSLLLLWLNNKKRMVSHWLQLMFSGLQQQHLIRTTTNKQNLTHPVTLLWRTEAGIMTTVRQWQ